jgi:hypothetical protein
MYFPRGSEEIRENPVRRRVSDPTLGPGMSQIRSKIVNRSSMAYRTMAVYFRALLLYAVLQLTDHEDIVGKCIYSCWPGRRTEGHLE